MTSSVPIFKQPLHLANRDNAKLLGEQAFFRRASSEGGRRPTLKFATLSPRKLVAKEKIGLDRKLSKYEPTRPIQPPPQ